jgi:hypothetical protein
MRNPLGNRTETVDADGKTDLSRNIGMMSMVFAGGE